MTQSFRLAALGLTLTLSAIGCGEDSTTPGPGTGRDSGSGTRFDAGPFGSPDAGGIARDAGTSSGLDAGAMTDAGATTPDAGMSTGTAGACTNAADEAIFASTDVESAVGDCAGDCFGARDCTTECVVRETSLSMGCAGCFGDAAQCTVDNCAFRCFSGGDSPDCMACRDESGCTAAFEMCAGTTG